MCRQVPTDFMIISLQVTTLLTNCLYSDINECNKRNGGCSQLCVNKKGSFECRCRTGFKLQTDGRTCSGINFSYPWCNIDKKLLKCV